MTVFALVFVLCSLVTHAYVNLLIKTIRRKLICLTLAKITEVVILTVPAILVLRESDFEIEFIAIGAVTAIFTFLGYMFLSKAYEHGDLSLVYPISRLNTLFLPFLSFALVNERIDFIGAVAIVTIVTGTVVMHFDSFTRKGARKLWENVWNPATLYALMAALSIAIYSAWHKVSLMRITPFVYFYIYTLLTAVMFLTFCLVRFSRRRFKESWRSNSLDILQIGFFECLTSAFVLVAMTVSKTAYVGGVRQLGIIIVICFSSTVLNERLTLPKVLGAVICLLGGAFIYFAG